MAASVAAESGSGGGAGGRVSGSLVSAIESAGIVSAGDASWYARPNDVADLAQKMVSLLGDELQRRRMGAIGRDRIEHVLSWQHEAPRLHGAYEHLLNPAGERK